jgi:hypothetical protein
MDGVGRFFLCAKMQIVPVQAISFHMAAVNAERSIPSCNPGSSLERYRFARLA